LTYVSEVLTASIIRAAMIHLQDFRAQHPRKQSSSMEEQIIAEKNG
jgi:hypothetical protein